MSNLLLRLSPEELSDASHSSSKIWEEFYSNAKLLIQQPALKSDKAKQNSLFKSEFKLTT